MVREGLRSGTVALRNPSYRAQLRHEQQLKDQTAVVRRSSRQLVKRRTNEDYDNDGPVFSSSSSDEEDIFIPIPRKRKSESKHQSNPRSPFPDKDDLYKVAWEQNDKKANVKVSSHFEPSSLNEGSENRGLSQPCGPPPETKIVLPIRPEELKSENPLSPVDVSSEDTATATTSKTDEDTKGERPSSPQADINAEAHDDFSEDIFDGVGVDWQHILESDTIPDASELEVQDEVFFSLVDQF